MAEQKAAVLLPNDYRVSQDHPAGLLHELEELNISPKEWMCCHPEQKGIRGCPHYHDTPANDINPIGPCIFRKERGKTGPCYVAVGKTNEQGVSSVRVCSCFTYMNLYRTRKDAGYKIVGLEGDTFKRIETVSVSPGHPTDRRMKREERHYIVPKFPRPAEALIDHAVTLPDVRSEMEQEGVEAALEQKSGGRRGPPADAR